MASVGDILTIRKNASSVLQDGSAYPGVGDCYGIQTIESDEARWLRDGRLYFYNRGNTTTPVTFTNTAILYTRPSLVIRVPSGTTIIPVHLAAYFETAAGVLNEAVWIACNNDVGAGTSTAVAAGTNRGNMLGKIAGNAGSCVIQITYTGDVTTTGTNPVEFARYVQPFADAAGVRTQELIWNRKTAGNVPMLIGPASLIFIAGGGTALTGYMTSIWAEFNSADLGF